MAEKDNEMRDALCPECGNAFKVFVDRILENNDTSDEPHTECPNCGCGKCRIE